MRDNVRQFLELLTRHYEPPSPVAEIGAFQVEGQESYADVRPYFGERRYLGCDMQAGRGVDLLLDAHRLPFQDGTLGTVLLLDTLEHVQSPAVAVREACHALREGGIAMIASVMNFPVHAFPSDYWRFTPAAFDYLLSDLPVRFVFSQGDAEFPHTVVGVGIHSKQESQEEQRFLAAIHRIEDRWSEESAGGPLIRWRAADLVLSQRDADRTLPELVAGRRISQSFVCPRDGLNRIDVKMSTFGRFNLCHVVYRLLDADAEVIAAYRLLAPHLIDGGWVHVPVPEQTASAGQRYMLVIESPDGLAGQTPAPLVGASSVVQGELQVGDEVTEGSLCIQVYCRRDEIGVSTGARRENTGVAAARQNGRGELSAAEIQWEQTRYLGAVIGAGFDSLNASLKGIDERLNNLERLQRETLEQSSEAAAISRALKRNPLLRRLRGGGAS